MGRLEKLKLLVVTGKGGVGKSTVSASLGALLANSGRTVLLVEVDPRESLHHLLDTPPSGGEIVEAAPRLYLQHIQNPFLPSANPEPQLTTGIIV